MSRILPATFGAIAEAARLIRDGRLVAFPTETVYGLGADAGDERAIAAIYVAKQRPCFNPLIVHVASLPAAARQAEMPPQAILLAQRFWPGPLTLVLPRRPDCTLSLLLSAGQPSIALRVPDHPVARALLTMSERAIAAPSANPSGRISPTQARHVAEGLGDKVDLVLDDGRCRVGLESTVLSLLGDRPLILRPGAVTPDMLAEVLGHAVVEAPVEQGGKDALLSPGRLQSHYAPRAALRLDAFAVEPGEALLAFGPNPPDPPPAAMVCNLSPSGDLVEAAANLFAMLHTLDRSGARRIAVMPVPESGLGLAINDRLRRAAAPRSSG